MSSAAPTGVGSLVPIVGYDEIVALMRAGVAQAGSQRAYANAFAIHEGDLSQVLRERRLPTERMALFVGVERQFVRVSAPMSPLWFPPAVRRGGVSCS